MKFSLLAEFSCLEWRIAIRVLQKVHQLRGFEFDVEMDLLFMICSTEFLILQEDLMEEEIYLVFDLSY